MRLSDLPNVEFFNTDKEHVQQKVFDIYTTITGRTLGEGDPVTLFVRRIGMTKPPVKLGVGKNS